MKNMTFLVLGTLLSVASANAANPGIICVQSTLRHILIETEAKQVRVSVRGQIAETLPILKTSMEYIETLPATYDTSYDLGEGDVVKTSFKEGSNRGTGALYHDGEKIVDYYTCYTADDITR